MTQSRPNEGRDQNDRRTTILYVDHTARWSGGEIALYRFLGALNKAIYRPVVVLAEEGPFAERLRARNIETIVLPLGADIRETRKESLNLVGVVVNILTRIPLLFRYAARIAAIARENRAVLIHCNSLKSDIYGAIAGKLAGIPVIWHIRDHISSDYLPPMATVAMRTLIRYVPSQVIFNSQSTLDAVLHGRPNPSRYTVATDCVDESFLALPKPPARERWPGDCVTVAIVGRHARWKGQHLFLKAAARLVSEQERGSLPADLPPLRFALAGDALFGEQEYEREIREQAERTLPPHAVRWLGSVDDIPGLLSRIDLLIHSSITPEPFGQVVIEGMAAGLPVIATNGGGVRETVANGRTGVLVPMNDADALVDAIRRLLLDPAQANTYGRAGWVDVRERFTPRLTSSKIESVYRRILGTIGFGDEEGTAKATDGKYESWDRDR